MDETSVTPPCPPSTRAIVADRAPLAPEDRGGLVAEGAIRDAFSGEPAEEVIEMVRWALSHGDDEGFDAPRALTAWAKKRGRGAWSDRPQPSPTKEGINGRLAEALARYWMENPHELAAVLDRVEASLRRNGSS